MIAMHNENAMHRLYPFHYENLSATELGNMPVVIQHASGVGRCMGIRLSMFRAIVAVALAAFTPVIAHAQTVLVDPRGSSPIVSAVQWLQGTLLGTVATVVAVIAVACVGLMMLTGRINWRYGAVVILGCFILFGAVSIVAGIQSTASAIR